MALPIKNTQLNSIAGLDTFRNGGKGSGNFGHSGRPGEVGGSAPAGSVSASADETKKPYEKMTKSELQAELESRGIDSGWYKKDKDKMVKRLSEDDTRKSNIKESEAELDRLGFTDEEKEKLKNHERVEKYSEDAKMGELLGLEDGTEVTYYIDSDGSLERWTSVAGNSIDNLEKYNPLAPSNKEYKKELEDLGFKHTSSTETQRFVNGEWQDEKYRENFLFSNTPTERGVMEQAPAGKSFTYASIAAENYRSGHTYLDAFSARHYKKVDDAKTWQGMAEYSINEMQQGGYGVNWSAWGTQDAKTTRHFADGLKESTEVAEKMEKAREALKKSWKREK